AACAGTPIPASMISGTAGKCARSAVRPKRLFKPRPEPMGDPHGISTRQPAESSRSATTRSSVVYGNTSKPSAHSTRAASASPNGSGCRVRSEEHTSELQSLAYLVCRLLLEKKKKKNKTLIKYFYKF